MSDHPPKSQPDNPPDEAPDNPYGIRKGQRVKLHSKMAEMVIEVEVESVEGDRVVVWDYKDYPTNEPLKPSRKFSLQDYPISAIIDPSTP